MPEALRNKITQLQQFEKELPGLTIEVCKPHESTIIEMNQRQLFDFGQRADGTAITPPYTPYTKRLKRIKGQPVDRVTLKDTGAFYNAFEVVFQTSLDDPQFSIFSTDRKNTKLERKYKIDIYGLNQKNKNDLGDLIKPDLQSETRKRIV